MKFDTRIAVLVSSDLRDWQKLNVTAFTVSGIAGLPGLLGEEYLDGSGRTYLPMIRQPITVFGASRDELRAVHTASAGTEVRLALYTEELFSTSHDAANRAAIRACGSPDLRLVGLALFGPRKTVDQLLKGLQLHP